MKDYNAIKLLAKYPLAELRRRQRIVEVQIKSAYYTSNVIALERLGRQTNLLAAAIDLKCF